MGFHLAWRKVAVRDLTKASNRADERAAQWDHCTAGGLVAKSAACWAEPKVDSKVFAQASSTVLKWDKPKAVEWDFLRAEKRAGDLAVWWAAG